jgi:misacylated tRNA(Ala) deacylase
MKNTELLYKEDSYLKEFDAIVVKAGPKYVILDRSAFYPEGGGQPFDTGKITHGNQTYQVIKVMQRAGQLFHYLDGDIPEGAKVHGEIDWKRRFKHIRLHSAEHLLTGLFEDAGSGPKVFSSFSKLEFKPSNIDESILHIVEEKFNKIIDEDIPIEIYNQNRQDVNIGDDSRKLEFLHKIPDNVRDLRMVKIGSYALTFCMGTHVRSTDDIGKLKELRVETKKKGRKIVYFELGDIN